MDFCAKKNFLLLLPSDILKQHILKTLDILSLVSCSLSHPRLRALILQLPKHERKFKKQQCRLEEIFELGYLALLNWFQNVLRYPTLALLESTLRSQCLYNAAKGTLEKV